MINWKKNIFCFAMFLLVLLVFFDFDLQALIFQDVEFASSPNPVGSGARATGMGGAFIGIADDATSASWNPAGLIQLERPEISVVGAYLYRRESFFSEEFPEKNNTVKVDDLNINYFSATYPFQFYRNMVFSINYQRLYEFKRNYDYQYHFSPQGVEAEHFKQKGHIGALGLAYAIEAIPILSFGASLNLWTDKLIWENEWEETLSRHVAKTVGDVTRTIDTYVTKKYSGFSGVNANIGILCNMNKYVTIGIVVKTPFDASIHHEYNFMQITGTGPPLKLPKIGVDMKLRMPLSYGGGLAWRVSDALSFDLDVYRTEWDNFVLIDSEGNRLCPIDGRPERSSLLKDTTQVRFGVEYLFISEKNSVVVPLRAGIFCDPEPYYKKERRFYGAAIGSGFAYKRIIFDVAYQLRWGRNVNTGNLISDSRADIMQHLLLTSLIIHF